MTEREAVPNEKSLLSYPGYSSDDGERAQQAWETGSLVFDANVLLNLYRYKANITESIFECLTPIKSRCWITNYAAFEFHRNRPAVIDGQIQSYDDVCKASSEIISSFKKKVSELQLTRRHTWIDTSNFEELLATEVAKFNSEIVEIRTNDETAIASDPLLSKMNAIFEARIHSPFSAARLLELSVDAEDRYNSNIPPGYKDSAKSELAIFEGSVIPTKYGDYLYGRNS